MLLRRRPKAALALPTYLLFARAGLTDTPWAIIVPSLVSPFGVYLMRVYAADRAGNADPAGISLGVVRWDPDGPLP